MPVCPHCGFTVDEGAVTCPLCGSELGTRGPSAGERTEDARQEPGARLDWEDPSRDFAASLASAWRTSLFEPARFFRSVGWEGALGRPILYYLLMFVLAGLFGLLWQQLVFGSLARHLLRAWAGTRWGGGEWPVGRWGAASGVFWFFLSPFVGLFALGVWTVILHVFVLVLVPTRRGIGETARVVCYSWGPALLTIVPVVGPLAAYWVWIPILQVVGLREAHRTTTTRALLVWLAPLVLLLLLGIALAIFVALAASAYMGHGGAPRRI